MFLRRLIDLSTTVTSLHHHITISSESRKDILWWFEFLPSWNGTVKIQADIITSDEIQLSTDASGFGLGGFFSGKWFSIPFTNFDDEGIVYFELLAIVFAVFCWGSQWTNKQILLLTDNEPLCDIWCTGTCKNSSVMFLIRKLFFFTAKHNINLLIRHVEGKNNIYADLLSRLQVEKFKKLCPNASTHPSPIPEEILALLPRR